MSRPFCPSLLSRGLLLHTLVGPGSAAIALCGFPSYSTAQSNVLRSRKLNLLPFSLPDLLQQISSTSVTNTTNMLPDREPANADEVQRLKHDNTVLRRTLQERDTEMEALRASRTDVEPARDMAGRGGLEARALQQARVEEIKDAWRGRAVLRLVVSYLAVSQSGVGDILRMIQDRRVDAALGLRYPQFVALFTDDVSLETFRAVLDEVTDIEPTQAAFATPEPCNTPAALSHPVVASPKSKPNASKRRRSSTHGSHPSGMSEVGMAGHFASSATTTPTVTRRNRQQAALDHLNEPYDQDMDVG